MKEPELDELVEINDDLYPTTKSIRKLQQFEFDQHSAAVFLAEVFPGLCERMPARVIEVHDETNDFDEPIKRIVFATGGWSGCELLIRTMLQHFCIKQLHTLWKRGGYYEFEVPARRLSKPDRAKKS